MNTSKSLARLRMLRAALGRNDETGEGETEAGFTLIELMVVLLIMAILLAIAIPTFLSVTNSAKKTATQSDLTNTIESATALYTNDQTFPVQAAPTTTVVTPAAFKSTIQKTQTTITYKTATTVPAKAKNVVSFDELTPQVAVFSGIDGATYCWLAAINETSGTVTIGGKKIPAGDQFAGAKLSATVTCTAANWGTIAATSTPAGFSPNFKTVKGT